MSNLLNKPDNKQQQEATQQNQEPQPENKTFKEKVRKTATNVKNTVQDAVQHPQQTARKAMEKINKTIKNRNEEQNAEMANALKEVSKDFKGVTIQDTSDKVVPAGGSNPPSKGTGRN